MTQIPIVIGDENVKKTKTCSLIAILIVSSVLVMGKFAGTAKADEGYAKVYIICLPDVAGAYTDPEKVKNGAIEALNYRREHGTPYNLPYVHPKLGRFHPFYDVNYTVVTDWNTYKNIFESSSCRESIVINTHGEIIPIPSGYPNPADWVNMIADAMLQRRMTWVHVAMYPFYYVWHQGATSASEWPGGGPNGFQTLMSRINLPDVTCWSPDETERVDMRPGVQNRFRGMSRWDMIPLEVTLRRPLRWSDFRENIIMSIYEYGEAEVDRYSAAAIIAFAATAGQDTFDGSDMYGFGAYVHIGTYETFGGSGDIDFDKGYLGAAAALFAEINVFDGNGMAAGDLYLNCGEQVIFAVPTITSYTSAEGYTEVNFGFTVFASLRYHEYSGQRLEYIDFRLSGLPPGCEAMMDTALSKNGYGTDASLSGFYLSDEEVFIGKALMGLLTLAPEPVSTIVRTVSLFSEWLQMITRTGDAESGVNNYASRVEFTYTPAEFTRTYLGDYIRDDYESVIGIRVRVPETDKDNWRITSFNWETSLYTTILPPGGVPCATGSVSTAIWFGLGDEVTIFYDDFEEGFGDSAHFWEGKGWSAGDGYSGPGGWDSWGLYDPYWGNRVWCARNGYNSIYGGVPNIEVLRYDKDMMAILKYLFDFGPYQRATLYFDLENYVKPDDYLDVRVESMSGNCLRERITTDYFGRFGPVCLFAGAAPRIYYWGTHVVRFRFWSNNDNQVDFGAFLDNVEIRGILRDPHDVAINYLTISVRGNYGGTTRPLPGTHEYPEGESVEVKGIPDEGYRFFRWILDDYTSVCDEEEITVTMDSNHNLEAIFCLSSSPPGPPPGKH